MRSWLSLAALLAAVVALGAWVYLAPAARQASTHPLSTLRADTVEHVRLERAPSATASATASSPIVVRRYESGWRLVAPIAARADAFQVERLLAILEARALARYRAVDLARFGLDAPVARLTLDDQSFAYGAINAATGEQYVLSGEHVYVVPLAYGSALPREAETLIARQLFAPREAPVRFELPEFTARLEHGAWRISPPRESSADERTAWAEAWRKATALRAKRHEGAAPRERLEVTLENGRALALGVLQREPELVLLRLDEGIQYHFSSAVAKRLLEPPGAR